MKKLLTFVAVLGLVSVASATTFTADGGLLEPTHGYTNMDRIGLVTDGSFEAGCDVNWACAADNACLWIQDLVPLGLWNYDGVMTAWFGGFCSGLATCYSTITQDIDIDGNLMSMWWMAYVNDAVGEFYVDIDGTVVFSFVPQLSDHLLDYQQWSFDVGAFSGMHTVTLGYSNEANCAGNLGDNIFVDYVELAGGTAAQETNFSSVKSLY
jgi:hypothetical protein